MKTELKFKIGDSFEGEGKKIVVIRHRIDYYETLETETGTNATTNGTRSERVLQEFRQIITAHA
jgi:hypothetical protein